MENVNAMTNTELLTTFYIEAQILGVAIGSNKPFADILEHLQELWVELSERFIKPQKTAR